MCQGERRAGRGGEGWASKQNSVVMLNNKLTHFFSGAFLRDLVLVDTCVRDPDFFSILFGGGCVCL